MKRKEFLKLASVASGSFMINGLENKDLLYKLNEIIIYDNYIRGSKHYIEAIRKSNLNKNSEINLRRESDNIHDRFAIAICCNEHKIGYIPAFENIVIANMIDNGVQLKAHISKLNMEELERYNEAFLAVKITTKLLVKQDHIFKTDLTQRSADEAMDIYRS
ncbi:HIRAN domain-containing protein [Psychroflexus sp. MBR-150]|jgi:hypothetical protein